MTLSGSIFTRFLPRMTSMRLWTVQKSISEMVYKLISFSFQKRL